MLWLAGPPSLGILPLLVHRGGGGRGGREGRGRGDQLAFPGCHGKGSSEGRGGQGGVGWGGAACSSLPLHYICLTYFSAAKWRRRESWEEDRAEITG